MDGTVVLDKHKLKSFRRQIGLSQEALADACFKHQVSLSIASIKRAETGKRVLYRTAQSFAKVFGVPIANLVEQKGSISNYQGRYRSGPVLEASQGEVNTDLHSTLQTNLRNCLRTGTGAMILLHGMETGAIQAVHALVQATISPANLLHCSITTFDTDLSILEAIIVKLSALTVFTPQQSLLETFARKKSACVNHYSGTYTVIVFDNIDQASEMQRARIKHVLKTIATLPLIVLVHSAVSIGGHVDEVIPVDSHCPVIILSGV